MKKKRLFLVRDNNGKHLLQCHVTQSLRRLVGRDSRIPVSLPVVRIGSACQRRVGEREVYRREVCKEEERVWEGSGCGLEAGGVGVCRVGSSKCLVSLDSSEGGRSQHVCEKELERAGGNVEWR